MSPPVKSKKAAENKEEKGNLKDEEAKKKNKPQSTVPPQKDQPSIVKQSNGTSKLVQPKKVVQTSPYQMGETVSLERASNHRETRVMRRNWPHRQRKS